MTEMLKECFGIMGVSKREHKQGVCPVCGSTSVTYAPQDTVEYVNGIEVTDVYCDRCKAIWKEHYRLVFYQISDIKTKKEWEEDLDD